jgi:hypothetical protein
LEDRSDYPDDSRELNALLATDLVCEFTDCKSTDETARWHTGDNSALSIRARLGENREAVSNERTAV